MASDRKHDLDTRAHDLDDTQEVAAVRKESDEDTPNPPRTTTHGWTSPKFGSSGSGGAELEPGPERD